MIDKLIEPTIKYIKDKSKISLNKQQTINLINKTIQQLNFTNKTQLNKDEQKLVLSTSLTIIEKENSLEYILENLENERNQPVIDILEDDFNINENQIDRNDLKINFQEKQPVTLNIPNKKFKTLLIQSTTTNFNYESWSKIFSLQWFKLATFVTFVALFFHAWVGVCDIWIDYMKPTSIRLIFQCFTILWLISCTVWTAQILWRV